MNPKAIAAEAKEAGLTGVALPTKSVADQPINNGSRARTFASYIRIHTLESTGGKSYAEIRALRPKTARAPTTRSWP